MLGFMDRFVFRNVGVVTFVPQKKKFYNSSASSYVLLSTWKSTFIIESKSAKFNKSLHLFDCKIIICYVREGMGVIVAKEPEKIQFIYLILFLEASSAQYRLASD